MNTERWSPKNPFLDSEPPVDSELAAILESYLTALESGMPLDRATFLAQHPAYAARLAEYLPWVELLCQAGPREGVPGANPPMPARLGDFRVLGEIGRGGMGIVYEAEQISLERRVALKVLPFASMLDERQLTRFKHEALAAAQLHHPSIVPVFAVGCEQGLHFYVMQLIEGHSLDEIIRPVQNAAVRESTVPLGAAKTRACSDAAINRLRTAARWFVQAAEALDHAHNQGIVHRDIKPSNLMISGAGDLWVTDFGLARTCRDASMTATGELVGTLRYMSPEQMRSKPGIVDHRTDIYSLGLTLYELISGRPAFTGQTQTELTWQIEHDDPPSLVRLDPRVPRDLDSIVAKAIARSPEGRYPSARDMADDLRAFLAGRPTVARPPSWRDRGEKWLRRHSRLAASAAVALAIIVVCAVASTVLVWRAQSETQRALELASDNHRQSEEHFQDARQAVDELFTGVATDLADLPGAESVRHRLLTQARAYYQKFAARAGSNPAVRAETAAAYYRSGQISELLGDDDAARAAYVEARRVWSALRAELTGGENLRPLALCENNLGLIALRAGRLAEAESHLRAALELGTQRVKGNNADAEATSDLALNFANLGMTLGQAGRPEEALTCLQSALEMQLAAESPSSLARGDLAATYNQLGYVHSLSSPAAAEADFRRAAEEFERLAAAEPHVMRWQAQLATALNNLAALAATTGRPDEAEAAYRRAIDIQSRLSQQAPQVVGYLRDLAVSRNNFGFLLSQQHRAAAAIEQFDHARADLTRLTEAHPGSAEYASRLGAVCNNLGLACEQHQATERSQDAYREAIAWQQQALKLSPNWRQAQSYLEAHTANLARLLRVVEPREVADELAQEPLESAGGAVELTGATPQLGHPRDLPVGPPANAPPRLSD